MSDENKSANKRKLISFAMSVAMSVSKIKKIMMMAKNVVIDTAMSTSTLDKH